MGITLLRVRRRCLVCDHEMVVEEPADTFPIGEPCGVCNAPTERVRIISRLSDFTKRNPHAAALGHLGGLKGGPARAARLSPARRREIAVDAARRRWDLARDEESS